MRWQVQEAKQKFSEVLRLAEAEGPQVVTRHGDEVAVVIAIREYRRLRGEDLSFEEFLLRRAEPHLDDAAIAEIDAIVTNRGMPRPVELWED
ncbi:MULTISPECIES: type II toxin-antitoxin system Phd/YefM family antitoxin [unclassified Kitasatospora]|uniref:type II toxin-antitoxin system Phd/YefM family antitoxin n=1 Tax=unclassified Kitasatospora TaxID=2633591 RepID=UPI0007110F0C|nr:MULTISPECIES: type II toxin-antitoxin system Phd/YefM family antitoxin [unclassified Kitasatospora]KQV05748.1 prevent-host-death protein [Kitasatospora sp. Root107]KRB62552.1 prevent-host-death protein [Kitasatospora sp. Root187]